MVSGNQHWLTTMRLANGVKTGRVASPWQLGAESEATQKPRENGFGLEHCIFLAKTISGPSRKWAKGVWMASCLGFRGEVFRVVGERVGKVLRRGLSTCKLNSCLTSGSHCTTGGERTIVAPRGMRRLPEQHHMCRMKDK